MSLFDARDRSLSFAARAALLYAVFGVAWIVGSDWLAHQLTASAEQLRRVQTWKGWLFVGLSSGFLYALIRREARARSRSRRLYSTIVDLLPDALILRRKEDAEILHANPTFREWNDVGEGEAVGSTVYEVGSEFRPEERNRYERALEEDGEVRDFTFHFEVGGEARVHLVSSRVVPYRDDDAVLSIAKDITERERARIELERSERRYRQLFEKNVAGTFVTDLDGTVIDCNDAFAEMLGYRSADDLRGTDVRAHYAEEEDRQEYLYRLREQGALAGNELRLRRRDGEEIWVLENSFLVSRNGKETVNMGTLVEITDRKRLEERLDRMAHRDSLTGLANRRLLREQAERALAAADRRGDRVGLIFVDLIRFKRVNDSLGHRAGDEVLARVGRRLDEGHRGADVTARLGGDEFAVLLTGLDEPADAAGAARRLEGCLEEPFEVAGQSVRIEASFGIAVYPDHATTFQELLSRADRAMYEGGEGADGRISMYEPPVDGEEAGGADREEALRRALSEDELELRYQPVYRVDSGELVGAEALVRWDHPRVGLVRAGEFVPLAERVGLAGELDRWALEAALEHMAEWGDGAEEPEWVSLNVSAASLESPSFGELLSDHLGRNGDGDGRLVLEIAEGVATRDPRAVGRSVRRLQDLGARVALDDFGAGTAALSQLSELPVDLLKLDGSFVRGVSESGRRVRLVEGVCALARELEMELVAEAVTDADQLRALGRAGVHMAQGHWLGRPRRVGQIGESAASP